MMNEIDKHILEATGRGPPGPEPEIPRGLPADCSL
jgi:hypothetical protein